MTSSLQEVIEKRQATAAKKARAAATRLAEGDSGDLRAQLDCEEALDNLAHYTRVAAEVRAVADDLEPYGRRSGNSLLRDLAVSKHGDEVARNRLAAHQRASTGTETVGIERRDLGSGSVFAQVPGWLTGDPAPTSINRAPLLAYAQDLPLHTANDVRLVGFGTNVTAAAQTATNASISNADFSDTTVTLPIRTFAGSITTGQQLLEQGARGVDAQVLPRTVDAVNAAVDSSVINGDGTNGTVIGLRNRPSASTQTYTDASPTAAEFLSNVEQLVRKVEVGRGGSPVVVMHPRRLSWLRETVATATAPIAVSFTAPQIPGATLTLNGSTHIIADANIPTTVSTNQDVVCVLRDTSVLDLYASPHVVFLDFSTGSANLKVTIIVRRYAAFSAARLPAAVGILSGTGLAAP